MCVGMIETRAHKILLKGFHENYSDLLKKQHGIFKRQKGWYKDQIIFFIIEILAS